MRLFAKQGDRFEEVPSRAVREEAQLQRLLEQHSNLIPLDIDARRVVAREFTTSAGRVDHLVLDATGLVLVVETKLAKNADRRTVVAQAIDYAAQLTKYGPQALLDSIAAITGEDFTEGWFESALERKSFFRNLESNLRRGQLTMLIVMDKADALLKDAVRFVNRATDFSCLLAEVRMADIGGQAVVTVDLYGDETIEEKVPTPTDPSGLMDEDSFVKAKTESGFGEEAKAFLRAFAWAKTAEATTGPLKSGFFIAQSPFVANNYLGWTYDSIDIWATADVYGRMKLHLEDAPESIASRIGTRPELREGGKYGKVADVQVEGATEDGFRELFQHYLAGPKAEPKSG